MPTCRRLSLRSSWPSLLVGPGSGQPSRPPRAPEGAPHTVQPVEPPPMCSGKPGCWGAMSQVVESTWPSNGGEATGSQGRVWSCAAASQPAKGCPPGAPRASPPARPPSLLLSPAHPVTLPVPAGTSSWLPPPGSLPEATFSSLRWLRVGGESPRKGPGIWSRAVLPSPPRLLSLRTEHPDPLPCL